jgi:hypothetical protein
MTAADAGADEAGAEYQVEDPGDAHPRGLE